MNKDQRDLMIFFSFDVGWEAAGPWSPEQRLECSTVGSGGPATATASRSSQIGTPPYCTTAFYETFRLLVGQLLLYAIEQKVD